MYKNSYDKYCSFKISVQLLSKSAMTFEASGLSFGKN